MDDDNYLGVLTKMKEVVPRVKWCGNPRMKDIGGASFRLGRLTTAYQTWVKAFGKADSYCCLHYDDFKMIPWFVSLLDNHTRMHAVFVDLFQNVKLHFRGGEEGRKGIGNLYNSRGQRS